MSIKYKVIKQATPGIKGGGDYKYYIRACERKKVSLDEIAQTLSKRSTLSRADITATLCGFIDLIPELLLNNHTVELDDLGIFSLSLNSHAENEPRTDAYRQLKSVSINFRPSTRMKKSVKNPELVKSKGSDY